MIRDANECIIDSCDSLNSKYLVIVGIFCVCVKMVTFLASGTLTLWDQFTGKSWAKNYYQPLFTTWIYLRHAFCIVFWSILNTCIECELFHLVVIDYIWIFY